MPTIMAPVDGYIKIIIPPWGEAPLKIRAQWVGCILPINAVHNVVNFGALTGKNFGGLVYSVDQSEALQILREKDANAEMWWHSKGYPMPNHNFCFRVEEAEIVAILTKTIQVYDVVEMFTGLLEVGVGADDHPANMQG